MPIPVDEVKVVQAHSEKSESERLRAQLGRSPLPEEVYEEMTRDKGYSGKSKRAPIRPATPPASDHEELNSSLSAWSHRIIPGMARRN